MNKEDKAKVIAWTLSIDKLQYRINEIREKINKLQKKRLEFLEEKADGKVENIDISNVDIETFEGKVKMSVANEGDK